MRSDRDLASRLLEHGDEAAFRELFRRHTPRLLQFALRLHGGSQADAEDAVQDTWMRACAGLERFRWQSAFSTWLQGITLNVCREAFKRRGRLPAVELDDALVAANGAAPGDGRPIDLERAIRALPDGYREVLVLHDIEGYTHEEIGRQLGITAGGSKSQLSRARRAMRAALGKGTTR